MSAFAAIGLCFIFSVIATFIVSVIDHMTSLDEYSSHLAIMQYAALFFMFFVVSLMMSLLILI